MRMVTPTSRSSNSESLRYKISKIRELRHLMPLHKKDTGISVFFLFSFVIDQFFIIFCPYLLSHKLFYQLFVAIFFVMPSSGISSCLGTDGAVMCLLYLARPCYAAPGWALIWGCIQIYYYVIINITDYIRSASHRIQSEDSNLGPPGRSLPLCHLSYLASVFVSIYCCNFL